MDVCRVLYLLSSALTSTGALSRSAGPVTRQLPIMGDGHHDDQITLDTIDQAVGVAPHAATPTDFWEKVRKGE